MTDDKGQNGGLQNLPASQNASHGVAWSNDKSKKDCTCKQYISGAVWIMCESCYQWYHVDCVRLKGMTLPMVEIIQDYACPFCVVSAVMYQKLDNSDQLKSMMQDVVKTELKAVKEEIKDVVINATSTAMKESTPDVVSSVVRETKSYASVVEEKSVQNSQRIVEEVTRNINNDKVERERRKQNVVIMKVPESKAPSAGQRRADDYKFCHEQLLIDKVEIDKVWRGGKIDDTKDDFCRPLIVRLVDEESVDYWTDGGKGYRTDSGYWINRDLCRADRTANFLVRAERRKRTSQVDKKPIQ